MNNEKYVARKDVILRLGIHYHTVHAMAKRGDIDTIQVGTRKKYNLEKYIKDNNIASVNVEKENICYCRVSSQKQKEDLDRQILKMHELYPTYRIISDVALNIESAIYLCDWIHEICEKGDHMPDMSGIYIVMFGKACKHSVEVCKILHENTS